MLNTLFRIKGLVWEVEGTGQKTIEAAKKKLNKDGNPMIFIGFKNGVTGRVIYPDMRSHYQRLADYKKAQRKIIHK